MPSIRTFCAPTGNHPIIHIKTRTTLVLLEISHADCCHPVITAMPVQTTHWSPILGADVAVQIHLSVGRVVVVHNMQNFATVGAPLTFSA